MSGKLLGQVWDIVLPPAKLIVLMAYLDHADHWGNNIFPSRAKIAWKTGYSVRQVQRITDQLVKDGLLVIRENKAGKLIKYSADLSKGVKKPEFTNDKDKDKGGQDVTPDKMSPLTNGQGGAKQNKHTDVTPTPDMPVPDLQTNRPLNRHIEPLPAPTSAAIIDTWLKTQDAIKPKAFKIKANHELARALIDNGINCEDVKAYIHWRRTDPFWDKFLALEHIAENVVSWKKQSSLPQPAAPVEPPPADDSEFVTIPDGYFEGILK